MPHTLTPSTQDTLLNSMTNMILDEIRHKMLNASYYSIVCNETKDFSGKKTIVSSMQYMLNNKICEEFIVSIVMLKVSLQKPLSLKFLMKYWNLV